MNQILVTEKLYITPELKRKKKMYKFDFLISIFLVCILTSLYIYAEYDRNKSEETSQQILEDMNQLLSQDAQTDTTIAKDNILLVVLDDAEDSGEDASAIETASNQTAQSVQAEKKTTAKGNTYTTVAKISIPKIKLNYSVVQGETGSLEETEDLLKISPVKYHGGNPNEIGNFCIVGHNYRNEKFFSKVPSLVVGDEIQLTDLSKRTLTYKVYDVYTVDPNDTSCTTQMTGGKKELTLITCTNDSKLRVVVKCKEVK
ncbi:sortase [bacterium]|nr:sortase [bacterium]